MKAEHLEIFVEEPSMEGYLQELLPRLLGDTATFQIFGFQGKSDLLSKLPERMRGYSSWLPPNWRVAVVVDRDDQECVALKQQLEAAAAIAGLATRSATANWQVVNRIAIEELEAWYFGDWEAVQRAFPRVPATVPKQAKYRYPDAVAGGTWEAFQRILQRAGYYPGGLRKVEAARLLGDATNPDRSTSRSFQLFRDALIEATQ